mgnify:CR=1 FL=1
MEGKYYRHFKGNYYRLLHFAYDCETEERMVVYQAMYGEGKIWIRPEKNFFEEIESGEKRFTEVSLEEVNNGL